MPQKLWQKHSSIDGIEAAQDWSYVSGSLLVVSADFFPVEIN